MKKIFILLILSLSHIAGYTQHMDSVQLQGVNNLLSLINQHQEEDTVRVKLLMDFAKRCFYELDFINGFEAANEGRAIAKKIDYIIGEGLYLKSVAIFNQRIQLGNEFTKMHTAYYEVVGNRILQQFTNFNIFGGITIDMDGKALEIEDVISNLLKAQRHFSDEKDLETIANLQNALANAYFDADKEKHKEHKKRAEDLFHRVGLSYPELVILTAAISDLWTQGKEEKAKALEIKAIRIYTNEPNKFIKALCATLLGRGYAYSERKNVGLEYLFEAEEILKELREKDLLKNVYLTIATIYEWELDDSEKALEYVNKELSLRKALGFYKQIRYTYLMLFESLINLNRIQKLPDEFKDYLKIGESAKASWFDAELLWVMGKMLRIQGKSSEAQTLLQESMATYQKIKDLKGGSAAAITLAEIFRSDGDINNAIKFALQSFEWASEQTYIHVQIRAADLLSQLYEQSGQEKKAFDFLKNTNSLNTKMKNLMMHPDDLNWRFKPY